MAEVKTPNLEALKKAEEKERKMRTLFCIAVDIKAGRLPATYSKKAAELAEKYSGEDLEAYAYGGY